MKCGCYYYTEKTASKRDSNRCKASWAASDRTRIGVRGRVRKCRIKDRLRRDTEGEGQGQSWEGRKPGWGARDGEVDTGMPGAHLNCPHCPLLTPGKMWVFSNLRCGTPEEPCREAFNQTNHKLGLTYNTTCCNKDNCNNPAPRPTPALALVLLTSLAGLSLWLLH